MPHWTTVLHAPTLKEAGTAENLRIGVIGDRDPDNTTHAATNRALAHAAESLGVSVDVEWLPTGTLEGRAPEATRGFDALFCSPVSPYRSLDGALEAVRVARENGIPFMGI